MRSYIQSYVYVNVRAEPVAEDAGLQDAYISMDEKWACPRVDELLPNKDAFAHTLW